MRMCMYRTYAFDFPHAHGGVASFQEVCSEISLQFPTREWHVSAQPTIQRTAQPQSIVPLPNARVSLQRNQGLGRGCS